MVSCWLLRRDRNVILHDGRGLILDQVCNDADSFIDDFLAANLPPASSLFCSDLGVAVRNATRIAVFAAAVPLKLCGDVEVAEARAILTGIQLTAERRLLPLLVETDSLNISRLLYGGGAVNGFQDFQDQQMIVNPQRPTTSSMSSTVESFSGPRPPQPAASGSANLKATSSRRYPRTPPVVPEDCHSDCDSSSSVIDNNEDNEDVEGDITLSSSCSRKQPLPFDLNFPPLDDVVVVDFNGRDDLQCTALCL
ncbi:hypothetical protein JRO89_XS15G0166800 [Xanthoceras sorbifolium]|uniref:RNase H type-1 domain-containing protein n=1 Tax=Xanthoceras sorbifolium TaxID=99658 RepID=A0ABQ8H2J5_9ROSI|nr:hypothetical protein JRO89_XS15G0166800 [Xanthoceras sorbifolium]